MQVKKKYRTDFTVTPNEIMRHGLSLKAIGLYLYIINKPDGWEFSINGTATQVSDGIKSVRSAVVELEKIGFLVRQQVRNGTGKFSDSVWCIYDTPCQKRSAEKASTEKGIQVNNNKVNTKREREKLSLSEIQGLAKKYHVNEKAIWKSYYKYVGWADSDSKKLSKKYFISNWIIKEVWDINDLDGSGLVGLVGGLS